MNICHVGATSWFGGTPSRRDCAYRTGKAAAGAGPHVFITPLLSPLGGPPVLCDRATILAASAMFVGDRVVWKQS